MQAAFRMWRPLACGRIARSSTTTLYPILLLLVAFEVAAAHHSAPTLDDWRQRAVYQVCAQR